MMIRRLILLLLITMSGGLASLAGGIDSLYRCIDNGRGDPVEGIWRMSGGGATVAITSRPGAAGQFDITLIDSPDLTLIPYCIIGSAVAGIEPGTYDLSMVQNPKALRPKRNSFIARFENHTDIDRLTLQYYRKGKRISLWRWIPYLFRVTVIENSTRPNDHDGLLRLYPPSKSEFIVL